MHIYRFSNEKLNFANVLAIGVGHVSPTRANGPGLVYDIKTEDYDSYVRSLNFTDRNMGIFLQRKVNCSDDKRIAQEDLNYPSFSVLFKFDGPQKITFKRVLTNVGQAHSTYTVKIDQPEGVRVVVKPEKLDFTKLKQEASFSVTFVRIKFYVSKLAYEHAEGSLEWVSGHKRYSVRSPISITFSI